MNIYCSISKSGRVLSISLALALGSALIIPTAFADDGNCGNGEGTGNGCLTGVQGPSGPQGPAGAPGLQGPAGPIGPQGPKGETGTTGAQGVSGAQGPKGDTGTAGPQGASGLQGLKGDTGAQGPQGASGSQGPKGDTGPQGSAGAVGAAGAQGPQGFAGAMGLQGQKGEKGDQGEPGLPGSVTSVTQVYTGSDQTSGDTRQTIPGASLTSLVPIVQVYLPNGDFVLNANIDVGTTLPIGQQYTCQLKVANQPDSVDSLPIIYAVQTRLSLGGAVHLYTPAQVTVSCGSDAPARVLKARLNALHVDHINPAIIGVLAGN